MTAPTAAPVAPAGEAPPEPRLRGPVRLVRELLPYVLALLLAFVVSGIVIAALGYDAIEAFRTILSTSFRTGFGFTETLTKWVPLVLLALGVHHPARRRAASTSAARDSSSSAPRRRRASASSTPTCPSSSCSRSSCVAGILAGAVWAGIAALLMGSFGVNEILSTVLLNFVSFGARLRRHEVWSRPGRGGRGHPLRRRGRPAAHLGGPPGDARRHAAGRARVAWPPSS